MIERRCCGILAAGLLLATSCADPRGDLDPGVVADLARAEGDAQGYDRTGIVRGSLEQIDCPCPTDAALETLSLCSLTDLSGSGQLPGDIEVVQTNGHLVLNLGSFVLTGSIDRQGELLLGAVSNLKSVISDGYVVTRAEGELALAQGADFELEVDIRHRITGQLMFAIDPDVPQSIDCTERLRAVGSLPAP